MRRRAQVVVAVCGAALLAASCDRTARDLSVRCDALFAEVNDVMEVGDSSRLASLDATRNDLREALLVAGDQRRWPHPLYIANREFARFRGRWPLAETFPTEAKEFLGLGWACNRVAPRDPDQEDLIEHTEGVMREVHAMVMRSYALEIQQAARSPDEVCAVTNLQIEIGVLVGGPLIDCSDRRFWPDRDAD